MRRNYSNPGEEDWTQGAPPQPVEMPLQVDNVNIRKSQSFVAQPDWGHGAWGQAQAHAHAQAWAAMPPTAHLMMAPPPMMGRGGAFPPMVPPIPFQRVGTPRAPFQANNRAPPKKYALARLSNESKSYPPRIFGPPSL